MAFTDDPHVDFNSKRSEESVHTATGFFTQKNGFISRTEYPDYGVDLDVELINKTSGATSKKFGIQIKSTSEIKTVTHNNEVFISLPFKTSRLGYLARRIPTYGLILIYDEKEQITYFDYVEEIILRLRDIKENDSWKEQESVSILIPKQKLDIDSIKAIHEKFSQRFENHSNLIRRHGKEFNIPNISFTGSIDELSFEEDKVSTLEKYGSLLFNENEYHILINAIESLSPKEINASTEILFVAALTYSYTGDIIEGQYYVQKAERYSSSFSEEQLICLEFAKYYVEFAKGNLTHYDYSQIFASKLNSQSLSEENRLLIRINTLWFSFLNDNKTNDLNLDSLKIEDLLEDIESSSMELNTKHLYRVFIHQTYHLMAVDHFLKNHVDIKLKESLGIPVSLNHRVGVANKILNIIDKNAKATFAAYEHAGENYKLLKATAAEALCKNFLSFRSAVFSVDYDESSNVNDIPQYEANYNFAVYAYTIFLELGLYQNAYETICSIKELVELCELVHNRIIGTKTNDELSTIIQQMQDRFGFKIFVSSISKIAESKQKKKLDDSKEEFMEMSEEILLDHAKKILNAYQLPKNRLDNIFLSLKTLQTFEVKNSNPNIELLENLQHTQSKATLYATTPLFILKHKITGIETKPSSDIQYLLDQFSTIL